jgi:alpha-1,3-glucosyltransferase
MIIIDHGHFQYNNVMHGFFVFAVFFLLNDQYIFAIIFLVYCVNYKQMGLYYAIIFPCYVIKKLIFSEEKNLKKYFISCLYIILYGIITILGMGIVYFPWIKNKKLKDVFHRIFPVQRGIFEDKVATFWCVLNIFIKLKNFDNNNLIKFSLILTLLGCLLPVFVIFKSNKITKKICIKSFFIVSFSFYLFSYHVHEKTIIVPFVAFLINLPHMKKFLPSFTLVAMFSLFPLLKRENQIVPYYLTTLIYYFISKLVNLFLPKKSDKNNIYFFIEIFIFIMMVLYHVIEYKIPPPEKYPWFYPMINALFCFCCFFGLFLYSNYSLIKMIFKEKIKNEN